LCGALIYQINIKRRNFLGGMKLSNEFMFWRNLTLNEGRSLQLVQKVEKLLLKKTPL